MQCKYNKRLCANMDNSESWKHTIYNHKNNTANNNTTLKKTPKNIYYAVHFITWV